MKHSLGFIYLLVVGAPALAGTTIHCSTNSEFGLQIQVQAKEDIPTLEDDQTTQFPVQVMVNSINIQETADETLNVKYLYGSQPTRANTGVEYDFNIGSAAVSISNYWFPERTPLAGTVVVDGKSYALTCERTDQADFTMSVDQHSSGGDTRPCLPPRVCGVGVCCHNFPGEQP